MADGMILDAAVLVDYFRGSQAAHDVVEPLVRRRAALLHPVIHAELLVGARDRSHRMALDAALSKLRICSVRNTDMLRALDLVRMHTLSNGIGWPDCFIAATCLRVGVPIVTVNDKHFKPIRGLSVVRPY